MLLDMIISLGWGTVSPTREKAEKMVDQLIARGDLSREEAKKTINELVDRGEKERAEVRQYLQEEAKNIMQKYNIVTREEYLGLQEKINILEQTCKELEQKCKDIDNNDSNV